ncbi:helix-turn-helix domain-containing protein [Cytobacillus firmus]|uniref:helix-turn-helix domain-containing protein n=1 Tax=Cytobacillus firmus TaxID=1399 RepID=UPI0022281057|nr:helix-turn-helix domain-containing protein [Cytobacillus firmus]
MERSYLKTVIMYCIKELQGQRTIYSILHLLNGKKSSQTIQDAHLFQLTPLFRTFGSLSRDVLDHLAQEIVSSSWMTATNEKHYILTAEGKEKLERSLLECPIPSSLNGWLYHSAGDLFWERITLLIQVISHLNNNNVKYLPIQRKRDVHEWLKNFLRTSGFAREEVGGVLNRELCQCLERLSDINPAVLTLRLTGYNRIGLTAVQASEQLGIRQDYYHHQFLGAIHHILASVRENAADYPLIDKLVSGAGNDIQLTLSAQRTYTLLNQGLDLDVIAKTRNLKKSTIEDHVVEVALNDSGFNITRYVSEKKQKLILQAASSADSLQLKQIRQMVPESDYFEIRLVMAKLGEGK